MSLTGWKRLLADATFTDQAGQFPIPAYSEYMPPPWVALKPCGGHDDLIHAPDDNYGWRISEYEQAHELRPGLQVIAREVLKEVVNLGRGLPAHQISHRKLRDNPYWPPELAAHAGKLAHERYVILAALALSRTQDDKGRVPWTLFGASEQGPARAFWRGFYTAPRQEAPEEQAVAFFRRLFAQAYGVRAPRDLARAGLRILPAGKDDCFPYWARETFPSWARPLLWQERAGLKGVKFLLTFRPFARLPDAVRQAYLAGDLHLLPFPGSLVFWGAPDYRRLQEGLPFAVQVPLLHLFPRYNHPHGLRIPQAGWLHEKVPADHPDAHTPHRPHFQRTHRWQPVHRDQDETAVLQGADPVTRVLFSTDPHHLGLYGKPMARNVQVWTHDYRQLLDGPRAGRRQIDRAERALARGGMFGYRFLFPPMRVGPWEVYWHRPLAAFPAAGSEESVVLDEAPAGYLTAYRAEQPDLERPVELWPRLLDRPLHRAAVECFAGECHPRLHTTTLNVRSILEYQHLLGPEPLPRSMARALLLAPRHQTLEEWLASLPERATDGARARRLVAGLEELLAPADEPSPEDPLAASLTFAHTSRREFEVAYWQTIAALAHGRFRNKDNADCIRDPATRALLPHNRRDLEALGNYLMRYYAGLIGQSGLGGRAWVGEHAFAWRTDFDFRWMGGWTKNQRGPGHERNLVVRIPGRDPRQAVVMADHYDTAYMADHYEPGSGGTGARLAAAGADDNHSATAALMLAAPVFLEMSRAGRLGCDVWLVHLTGEEFPSDCLGARHLCRALVEGNLSVREPRGKTHDLSAVRVKGVYVSDMIAHNNDRERRVFQIAPGEGVGSAWLALQAHRANRLWNALACRENGRPPRRGCGLCRRSADPNQVPPMAWYPPMKGEVRPEWDARSTLYNTDGQIFSDVGVPVVLFMEDYDINRAGYHDSHDTLANIDLDYGAALTAIVIESVARAATEEGPG